MANEEADIMKGYMTIEQADGSIWAVPISIIAKNRAAHYADEYDGDVEKSLAEDTLPLFFTDTDEIEDWASNNMDWSDFEGHQYCARGPRPLDFQEAWVNGEKEFLAEDQRTPL